MKIKLLLWVPIVLASIGSLFLNFYTFAGLTRPITIQIDFMRPDAKANDKAFQQDAQKDLASLFSAEKLTNELEKQRTFFIGIISVLSLLLSVVGIFAVIDRWFLSDKEKQIDAIMGNLQGKTERIETEISVMSILASAQKMCDANIIIFFDNEQPVTSEADIVSHLNENLPRMLREINSLPIERKEHILYAIMTGYMTYSGKLGFPISPESVSSAPLIVSFLNILRGHFGAKDVDYLKAKWNQYFSYMNRNCKVNL